MCNDPATVRRLYNRWAETYDRQVNRTRDLDAEATRRVLGEIAFERVVEIGCGTGKNTEWLCRRVRSVVAIDFSPRMLAVARTKLAGEAVEFVQADAQRPWPFDDASVDLVTCNLVLEHAPELAPAISEAARTLLPGGHLFVSELHPVRQYQGAQAKFTEEEVVVRVPAHVHHVSEYVQSGLAAGMSLVRLDEWRHADDEGLPPRLLTLLWRKPGESSAAT